MYQIRTTEHERMSSSDILCHQDESVSISECITNFFEASVGCNLPWRVKRNNGSSFERTCSTKEDWKAYGQHYVKLLYASEKEIYDNMGCYFTCKYKVSAK